MPKSNNAFHNSHVKTKEGSCQDITSETSTYVLPHNNGLKKKTTKLSQKTLTFDKVQKHLIKFNTYT